MLYCTVLRGCLKDSSWHPSALKDFVILITFSDINIRYNFLELHVFRFYFEIYSKISIESPHQKELRYR